MNTNQLKKMLPCHPVILAASCFDWKKWNSSHIVTGFFLHFFVFISFEMNGNDLCRCIKKGNASSLDMRRVWKCVEFWCINWLWNEHVENQKNPLDFQCVKLITLFEQSVAYHSFNWEWKDEKEDEKNPHQICKFKSPCALKEKEETIPNDDHKMFLTYILWQCR